MFMIIFISVIVLGFIIVEVFYKKFYISTTIDTILSQINKKKLKYPKGKKRGIVIIIRNGLEKLPFLLHIINYLGSNLPIVVSSINDIDLHQIKGFKGINKLILQDQTLDQLPIYSLIYSPFEETILIDCDIILTSNPDLLFNDSIYRETGTLFWKEPEPVFKKEYNSPIKKLVPYEIPDNYILNGTSNSFLSEGIVLFDKLNHPKTINNLYLLANEDFIPKKELYWIAAELAHEPYGFYAGEPASIIGVKNSITKQVCGHYFHGWFKNPDELVLPTHIVTNIKKMNNIFNLLGVQGQEHEISNDLKTLLNSYIYIQHNLYIAS